MRKILVIDDEYQSGVIKPLQDLLNPKEEMNYIGETNASKSLEAISKHQPDVVLLDLLFDDDDDYMDNQGFRELEKINQRRHQGEVVPPIIVLTIISKMQEVIEAAYRRGAIFFLAKSDIANPDNKNMVYQTIVDADNWGKAEVEKIKRWRGRDRLEIEMPEEEPIIIVGKSNAMQRVYDQIEEAAESDAPVMIYGETGTGKELVARAIHYHSNNERKDYPFVTHNMAVVSGDRGLIISELFGCPWNYPNDGDPGRQGIFQEASNQNYPYRPVNAKGRYVPEIANRNEKPGTLFLDEIGRTPYEVQAMLLRVVEMGIAEDLSGQKYEADARLICATNENLYELSEAGEGDGGKRRIFRQDLLNRLEKIRIDVPPLNEHLEDIELLVHYFIEKANYDLGKNVQHVLPSTWDLLKRPIWEDANIRKLEILIHNCVRDSEGQVLRLSDEVFKYLKRLSEEEGG